MERRKCIQVGLAFGAAFVGERLLGPQPAEAAKLLATFYAGSMVAPSGERWMLAVGVAKTRVLASASPVGEQTEGNGFIAAGKLRRGRITMTLFDSTDPEGTRPLGEILLTLRRGVLSGSFAMSPGPEGTANATAIKPNKKAMKELAGAYEGAISTGPAFKAKGRITSSGRWELFDVLYPEGDPVTNRIAGYYVIDSRDATQLYSMILPKKPAASALAAENTKRLLLKGNLVYSKRWRTNRPTGGVDEGQYEIIFQEIQFLGDKRVDTNEFLGANFTEMKGHDIYGFLDLDDSLPPRPEGWDAYSCEWTTAAFGRWDGGVWHFKPVKAFPTDTDYKDLIRVDPQLRFHFVLPGMSLLRPGRILKSWVPRSSLLLVVLLKIMANPALR